jgi:hypothetical protein
MGPTSHSRACVRDRRGSGVAGSRSEQAEQGPRVPWMGPLRPLRFLRVRQSLQGRPGWRRDRFLVLFRVSGGAFGGVVPWAPPPRCPCRRPRRLPARLFLRSVLHPTLVLSSQDRVGVRRYGEWMVRLDMSRESALALKTRVMSTGTPLSGPRSLALGGAPDPRIWGGGLPAGPRGHVPRPRTERPDPRSATPIGPRAGRSCLTGYKVGETEPVGGGANYTSRRMYTLWSRPIPMKSAIRALPP